MPDFHIKIAGHVAAVSAVFESTRDYCRNYLTQDPPEFSVAICREDLVFEQQALDLEAQQEGMRQRTFTEPFLERTSIQRKVAESLIDYNVLLLHGSAVAVDGKGYLFTARCGTGKSTHTRLWRQILGSRAVMVNDDKPFVRIDSSVTICGSPWSGKHGLDTNICVPLAGICILRRGRENRIYRADPQEAKAMLLQQIPYIPLGTGQETARSLVNRLGEAVPLWQMECTKDPEAAYICYQAMSNHSI